MKMLKTICITTVLLAAGTVSSAWAVSLDDLQKKAVDNRDVIKKYKVQIEKYGQDVRKAKSGYLPSANLAYVINRLDKDQMFEDKHNSAASVTLAYNVFKGFGDKYGVRSARYLKTAQEEQYNAAVSDLKYGVALRVLAIYNAKSALSVAKDSHETISKLYKDMELKYEVGMISMNDLLKIQVDMDNAYISLKASEAALDKSVNDLIREAGVSVDVNELELDMFASLPTVKDESENQNIMLDSRSEIKYIKNIISSYEATVRQAKASYMPRVDVSLGYSRYDNRYANGYGDYNELKDGELRAQMTISMNLFDGFSRESSVAGAKNAVNMARLEMAELKQTLKNDLSNYYLDYKVSAENVKTAKNSIKQAEENLRITKLSHEEGVSTLAELLDAVANLSRAKYNEVNALTGLYQNYFGIQRAVEKY